jgi:hypothetical protein
MKLLLPAVAIAALAGCATTDTTPPLSVVRVHEAPGLSKQAICSRARDWAALTFKDSKAVVEVYDPAEGKLIGKGGFSIATGFAVFPISFTMVIECKDGRYRSTFENYQTHSSYGAYPLREDPVNNLKTKAEARTRELEAKLAGHVASKASDF